MYCLSFSPKAGSMCHNIAKTMHETLLKRPISTTFKIKYWKSPNTSHETLWDETKPQKMTQDILPSFCPAPIPPLVGSPAVVFLIVAALATLLPFAEVVSLLRCVSGATLSSRRWLETTKTTQQPEHRFEIKDPANWHPCQSSPPKIPKRNSDPKMIQKKHVFVYLLIWSQGSKPDAYFVFSM